MNIANAKGLDKGPQQKEKNITFHVLHSITAFIGYCNMPFLTKQRVKNRQSGIYMTEKEARRKKEHFFF